MRRGILIACATLVGVAGCATTSPVVPIGNGNYEIAGSSATALSSGAAQKVRLLQVANQYCNATGKQMVLMDANDINGHVGSGAFANGSARAAEAGASYHEGLFGQGGSTYAGASSASYNSGFIHPGQKASADVVFRCQ
ncbi:MAG: hypothetical protein WBE92_06245 [Steroidobacteraceae bacterium]